jgi:hypothetical protein
VPVGTGTGTRDKGCLCESCGQITRPCLCVPSESQPPRAISRGCERGGKTFVLAEEFATVL